jgi:hypothetical protein
MDKLMIPLMNRGTEVVLDATMKKLPIVGQSILGYRCITTTTKCIAKGAGTTSFSRRCLYGAGGTCSATAGILFLGSAATSMIAPNISIPLLATGEALLHAGCLIDGTADGISFIP